MRANIELLSGQIAIPAQDLERRVVGEATGLELGIEPAGASRLSAMRGSITLNVINGEEAPVSFSAAGTLPSVGIHNFFSYTSTGSGVACVHLLCAALTKNTSIIWGKILTALCTSTKTALFRASLLTPYRLFLSAAGAENSRPIWWKLTSADRAETVRPALFVLFPLALSSLWHVCVPPLSIVPYPWFGRKQRKANNE